MSRTAVVSSPTGKRPGPLFLGSSSGGFRPSRRAHLPKVIRGACRILSALLVGPRGRCGGKVPWLCELP
eukprot:9491073-Pyramimonas_sp.AAC.2